jgi:hypothetical protein
MGTEAPPSWSRETPWRQGHVLPASASKRLGLQHAEFPDDTCVIVIGHDCDLANDDPNDEPNVEVIVGRVVSPEIGSYMWSKSPRTLHVPFERDGTEVFAELVATFSVESLGASSLAQCSIQPRCLSRQLRHENEKEARRRRENGQAFEATRRSLRYI